MRVYVCACACVCAHIHAFRSLISAHVTHTRANKHCLWARREMPRILVNYVYVCTCKCGTVIWMIKLIFAYELYREQLRSDDIDAKANDDDYCNQVLPLYRLNPAFIRVCVCLRECVYVSVCIYIVNILTYTNIYTYTPAYVLPLYWLHPARVCG